jgi:uncharacterized protein
VALMLVDANLLLYAVDDRSPLHGQARRWLTERMNGDRRVGLPWQSLSAFLRIVTHPRISPQPFTPAKAWTFVDRWLAADVVFVPQATARHAAILGDLVTRYELRGNLVPDGELAALAIEHGLPIYSADTDFARFREVEWINPLMR